MFHKQRQVHLCLGCGWQDALYILAAIYIYHFTSSSHHILQLTGTAVATNISLVGQTVQHLIHNTIYIYIKKHLPNYFVCLKTKKKKNLCDSSVELRKQKTWNTLCTAQKKVGSCTDLHTAQCVQKSMFMYSCTHSTMCTKINKCFQSNLQKCDDAQQKYTI